MASVLLTGHQDSVYDVAWAPDGNHLASAGRDGMVRLWNTVGTQVGGFEFGEPVKKVAFSHDGRLLAIGTNSGRVEVRESASSSVLFQRKLGSVEALAFFNQTEMILVGSANDRLAQGLALEGGSDVECVIGQPVFSVRPSLDEGWLAIGCRGLVLFFSKLGESPLATFTPGENVDVYDCAIAPDGQTCAAAMRVRRGGSIGRTEQPDLFEIGIWRPRLGEEPLGDESLVGHIAWITCVEFSPDARLLVSASFDQSVRLWDCVQLRQVAELRGHGAAVYAARFSPEGDRLVTCSADSTIRIWGLDHLSGPLSGPPATLREPSSPRCDGVGADPLLTRAERLADELVSIESPMRLQETVEAEVPATNQELWQSLVQIGNVRAEQARRERNFETVRRWRRFQSEVRMRRTEFNFAGLLLSCGQKEDDAPPSLIPHASQLGKSQLKRVRRAAADYEKIILGAAEGIIQLDDARHQLALKPLDPLAVFVTIAQLQPHLRNVTAGRTRAVGLVKALEVLTQLLPPSTDAVLLATVFEKIGMLYCLIGDNLNGVFWLERAVSDARLGKWPQQLSSTLGNLGNSLHNLGRLQDAKAAYQECLEVALRHKLRDEFIIHSSNLANVFSDLGDFQSAFGQLRPAVGICRYIIRPFLLVDPGESQFPIELVHVAERYSLCLTGLAGVYREFQDDAGEAECCETAYKIDRALENQRGMMACLGRLADIDRRNGRSDSAEERYMASYALAQEMHDVDAQVHALAGLAVLSQQAARLPEAETLLTQAIGLAREHGLSQRLIIALCDLAELAEGRGSVSDAEAALMEAQEVADQLRRELRMSEEGPRIQQEVAQVAHALILLYLRSGRPVDAFEAAERARAGVFLKQLAGGLKRDMKPYSVEEVLRGLRIVSSRAVLVSYYVLKDRVCTFVLRADEDQPHAVERAVSQRELMAIRHDCERQVARRFARTEAEETWLRLSALTVDPVLPYLRDDDLLLIVPHGPLQGLPLHALVTQGRRLVEKWPIAYVPSASALILLAEQRLQPVQTCTVVGAHFTEEAQLVADVLGVELITGPQLDKDSVLGALARSDVVHMSTHGFYLSDTPRRSGLILHPSAETDEYLHVVARPLALTWQGERLEFDEERERMRPNILDVDDLVTARSQARLVTLSACETGLVRTDVADDPVGLVPALLATGVNGVVATLWLVDAETTAALMREFYMALKRPHGWCQIPYALRDAINTIRTRYPHPYNWAAVLLVGGMGRNA
jgi:CHAT domain-containing protein/tetratricopeptide (TPR) repeat protein